MQSGQRYSDPLVDNRLLSNDERREGPFGALNPEFGIIPPKIFWAQSILALRSRNFHN